MKTMIEHQPGRLPIVEKQLEELEAITFCKMWADQRKWLKFNNLDISEFEEEAKF